MSYGKRFPAIREFILTLGETLSDELFLHPEKDVWIAKTAQVFPSAYIKGPCIIDEEAEIRHCAFIRGSVIVGKHAVVGNSTELKNAILFDRVQVPHFNYIGDSVLGYRSHIGAGGVTSNVKLDKTPISVSCPDGRIDTGLIKFGAVLGDFVEVGCNSVLNPGTVIGGERPSIRVLPCAVMCRKIPFIRDAGKSSSKNTRNRGDSYG